MCTSLDVVAEKNSSETSNW